MVQNVGRVQIGNLNKEREKGITLIALVITIIVLLILAGVSIATITGENGILERAKSAKEANENATNDENSKISSYESGIDNYLTRARNGQLQSTILYPNGTAENPPVITTNQRIEIDNPYPGHTVYCVAQIQYNGYWGETGWLFVSGYGGYGVKASQLLGENYDKIIVQSGNNFIATASPFIGTPLNISVDVSSAPYRVIVVCLD